MTDKSLEGVSLWELIGVGLVCYLVQSFANIGISSPDQSAL
jgi:hypothetical protein